MIKKKIGNVFRNFDVCPVCGKHIATCAIKKHIKRCQQIFSKKIEIKNFNPQRIKYYKTYCNLIEKRLKDKLVDGYFETHHIIPKCVGGSNKRQNLIRLTAKEHFIAHLLLAEMFRYTSYYGKLLHALNMMLSTRGNTNSRKYEKYRIEFANQRSEQMKNKNSMQNKRWICNYEAKTTLLVDLDQVQSYIDGGWCVGKYTEHKEKLYIRSIKHRERINKSKELAEKLYLEYRKIGWKEFNKKHPGHNIQYWITMFINNAKSYESKDHRLFGVKLTNEERKTLLLNEISNIDFSRKGFIKLTSEILKFKKTEYTKKWLKRNLPDIYYKYYCKFNKIKAEVGEWSNPADL